MSTLAGITSLGEMSSSSQATSQNVMQTPRETVNEGGLPLKEFGGLSENQIVEFVNQQWRQSDQRQKPMQAIQDRLWQLYRNQEDFSDKEDWQSKLSLPKASSAVKLAAANLRKLLFSSEKWIEVTAHGTEELLAPIVELASNHIMQGKAFRFAQPLMSGLESGLAVGLGIWRIQPEYMDITGNYLSGESQDVRGTVTIRSRPVDYRNFKYGPHTTAEKFDWCIEDTALPVALLKARKDIKNVDKIWRTSFHKPSDEDRDSERFDSAPPTMRQVEQIATCEVREYWGDIIHPMTQEVVARNMHVLMLNRLYCGKIEKNPFWHKRPPYVVFSPLHLAFRFPGQGILETSREIFRAINKIANLQMDGLEYALLKQFEVDMALLENPEDLATGIEPGKLYRKRMGTNATPAIREIPVSPVAGGGTEMELLLDREIQRGTFVNDTVSGLTGARGEDTATEISQRVQSTTGMILSIARDIEEQALAPMAEMCFWLALQYLDSTTKPNWTELLGAAVDIDTWSPETRRAFIGSGYEFDFSGISEALRRQERKSELLETLQILGSNPAFLAVADIPKIVEDLLRAIGTGNYLLPNATQLYQQALQNQMQNQQQQAQQKLQMMQQQFDMRNASAMKRDVFKHQIKLMETEHGAGLQAALKDAQPQGGGAAG